MHDDAIAAFFDPEVFGVQVVVVKSGDIIHGKFQESFNDDLGIASVLPSVLIPRNELTKIDREDVLEINFVKYKALAPQHQSGNLTRIPLEELSAS